MASELKVCFGASLHGGALMGIGDIEQADFLQILGVTWDGNFTAEDYEVPGHIVKLAEEYQLLYQSQGLLAQRHDEPESNRLSKLNTMITSCLAFERLDVGDRSLDSAPLHPLYRAKGISVSLGFKHNNVDGYMASRIEETLSFGPGGRHTGLVILSSTKETRHCIVQMKAIHLARERIDKEKDIVVYGIVTDGDTIQFHRLKDGREVDSSPIFFLASIDLKGAWSYLRHIIHAVQLKVSPLPTSPRSDSLAPTTPIGRDQGGIAIDRWHLDQWHLNQWHPDPTSLEDQRRENEPEN